MELLLILSALLSAATGAFSGTPAPDSGVRQETSLEATAIAESRIAVIAVALAPKRSRPLRSQPPERFTAPAAEPSADAALATERLIE
jgi:hypothetical protein